MKLRESALRLGGTRALAARGSALGIRAVLLCCALGAAPPATNPEDSHAPSDLRWQVALEGPGNAKPVLCDVVPVCDPSGKPIAYYAEVESVISGKTDRETVTVRLHFDVLGHYDRYELPSGGNLTRSGGKPFSQADHARLHQILSDPYSPLRSIGLDEVTAPGGTGSAGGRVDAIARPTALSKASTVVVGAAYTCCTLWHWSHGAVGNAIRDRTIRACDRQDLLRYLQSDEETLVVFAVEQLQSRELFDTETIAAVVQVMRYGSTRAFDPALDYLEKASSKTGADHFFCCCDDEHLVADSLKRTRFLEALRNTDQKLLPGYLDRLGGWLTRADGYYEVHLLLTLREREHAVSEQFVDEAISRLESADALIADRCYRYLKAVKLSNSQQQKLEAFEREKSP